MGTTIETKAGELREECVRILCGRPVKNTKLLEEAFGKEKAASMQDGNGMTSDVQTITAALSFVLDGATAKKRGRPAKAKNADGTTPKRRGRPPKAAAEGAEAAPPKKRGRPKKAAAAAPAKKKRGRPKKTADKSAGDSNTSETTE